MGFFKKDKPEAATATATQANTVNQNAGQSEEKKSAWQSLKNGAQKVFGGSFMKKCIKVGVGLGVTAVARQVYRDFDISHKYHKIQIENKPENKPEPKPETNQSLNAESNRQSNSDLPNFTESSEQPLQSDCPDF